MTASDTNPEGSEILRYPLTRAAAALNVGYNIYVLARPSSLVEGLAGQVSAETARSLTRTWAGRDLPISTLAWVGDDDLVTAAVLGRVAADLTDGVTLGLHCTGVARAKALAVTLGWASVNVAAYLVDRSRRR